MKRLIALISTENKTTEQIVMATKEAWSKYQKVEKEVSKSEVNVPESDK